MALGTLPNYANEHSYKVYIDYLALKKHFTTKGYDYHKYRGKVKASFDSFSKRKDVFSFHKLSRKRQWHEIILANIVSDPNIWIGDIVTESGMETFNQWIKQIESLSYVFKLDLNKLDEDYKSNFVVVEGQHPLVIRLLLQRQISFETFTILMHLSNISEYWEQNLLDKYVAGDIINKSIKYYPFLDIDNKKFSNIIKQRFF